MTHEQKTKPASFGAAVIEAIECHTNQLNTLYVIIKSLRAEVDNLKGIIAASDIEDCR